MEGRRDGEKRFWQCVGESWRGSRVFGRSGGCPVGVTVITGERGCGKTTLLREYVDAASRAGRTVGGIASPVVYENGQRLGYDLLDLRRGVRRALARVVRGPEAVSTIGPFRFEETALVEGNAAIVAAVDDGLGVVAIDEVGPLEGGGGGGGGCPDTRPSRGTGRAGAYRCGSDLAL